MKEYGTTILMIVLLIGLFTFVFYKPAKLWVEQKLTNRKRVRAHAGKVTCEGKELEGEEWHRCTKVATRLTPNGYFCNDHWEENSKREVLGGGYITWNHILYHSIRRS